MAMPTRGTDVPIDQPLYGATFRQSVVRFLRKYATFTGRASRSEFWWAHLFGTIATLAAIVPLVVTVLGQMVAAIGYVLNASAATSSAMPVDIIGWMLGSIVALLPVFVIAFALLVPTYALGARRLHDAGLSGWLVVLSPLTSGVFMLVIGFLPSTVEGLQYEQPGSVPVLPPGFAPPSGVGGVPRDGALHGVIGQPFASPPAGRGR